VVQRSWSIAILIGQRLNHVLSECVRNEVKDRAFCPRKSDNHTGDPRNEQLEEKCDGFS
jgi:hypothetical protein